MDGLGLAIPGKERAMVQGAAAPTQEKRIAMTYEEYLAYGAETTHAEWVDGEIIVFMPPRLRHQHLLAFLLELLSRFCRPGNLGVVIAAPFEMRLGQDGAAREPDILFIAQKHIDRLSERRLDGPADLVIEIVSESSASRDRLEKFAEYQAAGIPEYLLLDPRPGWQRVDFYGLGADGKYRAILPDADGRYHSQVVPGFWFRDEWFWQDPLPNPDSLLPLLAQGV
jgi:Uma2 family endonuclease